MVKRGRIWGRIWGREGKVEVEGVLEEADVTILKALKAFLLWLVHFASAVSDQGGMQTKMVNVRCVRKSVEKCVKLYSPRLLGGCDPVDLVLTLQLKPTLGLQV
jgi:hypothetical protein